MAKQGVDRRRERRVVARRQKERDRRAKEDRRLQVSAAAVHVSDAVSAYRDRDFARAQSLINLALSADPRNRDALRLQIDLLRATRAKPESHLPVLRRLHELGEQHPAVLTELAFAEMRDGDVERAGALLAELRALRPKRSNLDEIEGALEDIALRRRSRREAAPVAAKKPGPKPVPPLPSPAVPPPEAAPPAPPAAAVPEITIALDTVIEPAKVLLDRARAPVWDSIARLRFAIDAHTLAAQERYDELLCLPHLAGVERFWHQEETVRRVLRSFRGRVLLADEVGLSKTIEAAMILKEYLLRGLVKTALILTPASIVSQWRAEIESKFRIPCGGTDQAAFQDHPDAFLDRHPIVVASLPLVRHERQRERFAARRFDLVVVDEAHRVKDHKSESYQLVDRLKSRFLLLLTATPVENDLLELYNLVTLLKPGQLLTRQAFRAEFVERGDPTSPRNRERLRGLLREVMVRNTRALSGARLPPRVAATIAVDPAPAEAELYARTLALVRDRGRRLPAALLAAAGSSPVALAESAARLGGNDPDLADLARQAAAIGRTRKDERLLDLVRREADRTAVFVHFTRSFEHVLALLRENGIAAAGFRGGMSVAEKDAAVATFRDSVPVLVSTDVGAEGLNLQFAANLINYDLPWNPMRIEQRIGRLHRIGQTREVRVWNLCTRGAAEDRLLDVLDRRLNLFEMVIGEMDMVLGHIAEERDFDEVVADVYRETRSEEEVAARFDGIAERLLAARGRYERARRLDEVLLGEDYEA